MSQAGRNTRCPIVLADRHISKTVQRAWASLRPHEKYRMIGEFVWTALCSDDEAELAELMEELKGAESTDLLTVRPDCVLMRPVS